MATLVVPPPSGSRLHVLPLGHSKCSLLPHPSLCKYAEEGKGLGKWPSHQRRAGIHHRAVERRPFISR